MTVKIRDKAMKVKVILQSPIVESDPPEIELGPYSQGVAVESASDWVNTQVLRCVATRNIIARQTRLGDWMIEREERSQLVYGTVFIQGVSTIEVSQLRDVAVTEGKTHTITKTFDG